MKSVARFITLPGACSYLPDRAAQMEYERVAAISASEYQQRMNAGWRRFGFTMFRPVCRRCLECQSLRVLADRFRPNRSQRRVRKLNEGSVRLLIGPPGISQDRLDLYDRYHAFQSAAKDWPSHPPKDADEYVDSFVNNPFPTHEYRYYLENRLVAVGLVDILPDALSAIYCYYDPDERGRSLGTWNVLTVIEQAVLSGRPYVYLGYYVAGCGSLEYKANFVPNQVREPSGRWRDFRV